ncbi:hypothetical protein F4604DRAFT_1902062 [Suillus subluteus]|nr:hypothetical protein F4604DRAFT_1902062 [Suillus subluteus]
MIGSCSSSALESQETLDPTTLYKRRSPLPTSVFLKSLLTLTAASRASKFRNLISKREGNKCAVTGALNTLNAPRPLCTREAFLHPAYILRRSVHDPGGNRIAGTIYVISRYTKLASSIMDDAAGIIDNPENGLLLEDVLHKYTVHWFRPVPFGLEGFTQVQFRDHSQNGIQPPNPTLIELHSAVAHVLYLSGAADVIDKVYDAFLDDGPMVPFGNNASEEDFLIRLSLIGLTTNNHQVPTNPHG